MIPWKRLGINLLWTDSNRRLAIASAFTRDGGPLEDDSAALMRAGCETVSSGYRIRFRGLLKPGEWSILARGLESLGVETVCGQVASGSSIAFALQAVSHGWLKSFVLGKEGYSIIRHRTEGEVIGKCAIVDDVVSSGQSMEWSSAKLKGMGIKPVMLFAFDWRNACPEHLRKNAVTVLRRKRR